MKENDPNLNSFNIDLKKRALQSQITSCKRTASISYLSLPQSTTNVPIKSAPLKWYYYFLFYWCITSVFYEFFAPKFRKENITHQQTQNFPLLSKIEKYSIKFPEILPHVNIVFNTAISILIFIYHNSIMTFESSQESSVLLTIVILTDSFYVSSLFSQVFYFQMLCFSSTICLSFQAIKYSRNMNKQLFFWALSFLLCSFTTILRIEFSVLYIIVLTSFLCILLQGNHSLKQIVIILLGGVIAVLVNFLLLLLGDRTIGLSKIIYEKISIKEFLKMEFKIDYNGSFVIYIVLILCCWAFVNTKCGDINYENEGDNRKTNHLWIFGVLCSCIAVVQSPFVSIVDSSQSRAFIARYLVQIVAGFVIANLKEPTSSLIFSSVCIFIYLGFSLLGISMDDIFQSLHLY